ncbi:hypothetical protein TNCV_2853551 [Trichonephila clavipes]|uniref:Uncharacterized protein n=1 Tax=Trichonephila clavipes TaxID=2585209 RepID=A0A8X6UQZ8_TRICX|nr:hypothetical protein TNCV_2853551 [Trichonephila clavipes]
MINAFLIEESICFIQAQSKTLQHLTFGKPSHFIVKKEVGILSGSPVVKVSDPGRHVMSSSPVPPKRGRCTLNLSRAQTSSHWCGVIIRRGSASSGIVLIT